MTTATRTDEPAATRTHEPIAMRTDEPTATRTHEPIAMRQRATTRTPEPIATLRLAEPFALARGGVAHDVRIGYEVNGEDGAPVIVALGGISAGRHVAAHARDARPGWWDAQVGPGRALDTRRVRVLSIDWLGGSGESSGPDAFHAADGRPRPLTTHDQARAVALVLDHLGIERAHAVVGASYGGMVALALAAEAPERVARVVAIAAAERSQPMATALRALQRRVVRLGVETGRAADALAIARGIAMTTYRTATEFGARFGSAPLPGVEPARFEVESYLERCGARFADVFDADAFLCLSESLDTHAVEPAAIRAATTLVAFDSDALVPPAQLRALYERLPAPAGFFVIPTIYGHDAFLKEHGAMAATLNAVLETRGES